MSADTDALKGALLSAADAYADQAAAEAVAVQKATDDAELTAAQGQVADLTAQVAELKAELEAAQNPAPPPPPPPPPSTVALLGHWDEFPDVDPTTSGSHNWTANDGVQKKMKSVGGGGSQIMHTYPGGWEKDYTTSTVAKSSQFGNAFLINQHSPGGAYGNTGYADVAAGKYDAQIAGFFQTTPATQAGYVTMDSEPDNHSVDATAWCKAVAHVVNVAAPIAKARGLKGGAGGLLMGYNFSKTGANPADPKAVFQKWNWLQYVDPAAMPFAVYMLDTYSKYLDAQAKTYESVPGICEIAFSQARAAGCTRFGIGEFANSREQRAKGGLIVGNSATQEAWIKTEIPKIRAIEGLEFAIYFAKPTGAESKNAELVDDSLGKPFTRYALSI